MKSNLFKKFKQFLFKINRLKETTNQGSCIYIDIIASWEFLFAKDYPTRTNRICYTGVCMEVGILTGRGKVNKKTNNDLYDLQFNLILYDLYT